MRLPFADKPLQQIAARVGYVAAGTGVGQIAIVATTPFLARIYTPQEFGELAILMSVTNIAFAAGCLRYELALPSCESHDVAPLRALCAAAALALAVGTWLACRYPWGTFESHGLQALLGRPEVVALIVLFVGWFQGASGAAVREGRFGVLAAMRGFQGIAFSALAFVQSIGLLWAQAISYLCGTWLLREIARDVPSVASVAVVAREYRRYPFYSLGGALLDIVAYSICIWVITESYGLHEAGQYSQAQRLIGAPLMLLGISLSQVVMKHAADLHRSGEALAPVVVRLATFGAWLAAAVLVTVFFIGEPLLSWFLGTQWRVDTYFLCTIVLAVAVRACVSPLSAVLLATGKLGTSAAWQLLYFASSIVVLPWLGMRLSLDGFVLAYALHEVVLYGIYLAVIVAATRT